MVYDKYYGHTNPSTVLTNCLSGATGCWLPTILVLLLDCIDTICQLLQDSGQGRL